MKHQRKQIRSELYDRYPAGSREQKVLEFSMASHEHKNVPPILLTAFKLLIGVATFVAIVAFLAFYLLSD